MQELAKAISDEVCLSYNDFLTFGKRHVKTVVLTYLIIEKKDLNSIYENSHYITP